MRALWDHWVGSLRQEPYFIMARRRALRSAPQGSSWLGWSVMAAVVVSTAACDIHPVPFDDPSPRSFVLPRLLRQCVEGFSKPAATAIVDLGAEPRRSLRLIPEGERAGMLALVGRREGDDGEGGALEVQHQLELDWTAQGSKGQTCYQFVLRGALAAASEEETGPVMGVLGVGRQGVITVGTDALDDASYDIEGEMLRRIGMLQPLLPNEPVGAGARWTYHTDGHLRGEYVSIDATYELLAQKGAHVRLGFTRHLRRPAQTIRGRKGEGERVDELDEEVRGVMELDLRASPLPTARVFDERGHEIEQTILAWR